MPPTIGLEAPRGERRFLKMFYTVQRTSPTQVRWSFFSRWPRDEAFKYLTSGFPHKDEIKVTKVADRELLMSYVPLERAEHVSDAGAVRG